MMIPPTINLFGLPIVTPLAQGGLPFGLGGAELTSIVVATIAALAAWSSQRSAAKASVRTVADSSRADIEKEAFTRAQGFLDGTIIRQNEEIADLRREVDAGREETATLRLENAELKQKVRELENKVAHLEQTQS